MILQEEMMETRKMFPGNPAEHMGWPYICGERLTNKLKFPGGKKDFSLET
jgi:hypothetical protein